MATAYILRTVCELAQFQVPYVFRLAHVHRDLLACRSCPNTVSSDTNHASYYDCYKKDVDIGTGPSHLELVPGR